MNAVRWVKEREISERNHAIGCQSCLFVHTGNFLNMKNLLFRKIIRKNFNGLFKYIFLGVFFGAKEKRRGTFSLYFKFQTISSSMSIFGIFYHSILQSTSHFTTTTTTAIVSRAIICHHANAHRKQAVHHTEQWECKEQGSVGTMLECVQLYTIYRQEREKGRAGSKVHTQAEANSSLYASATSALLFSPVRCGMWHAEELTDTIPSIFFQCGEKVISVVLRSWL